MSRILTPQQKIERSIVTDFRRDIWNKFVMGYERYDMIKPGFITINSSPMSMP